MQPSVILVRAGWYLLEFAFVVVACASEIPPAREAVEDGDSVAWDNESPRSATDIRTAEGSWLLFFAPF